MFTQMTKKRKHGSKANEPPSRQAQKLKQEIVEPEEVEEEEEEYEEAEEYEEVEEDEGDDEEDDDDDEETKSVLNQTSTIAGNRGNDDDDVEDHESIDKLLEPFGKEQLINLLREAADNHRDVADRIRRVADEDPVHRKIFVHGLGWDTNTETLMNAFKPYGEIEDCKAVCDKASGKSKGYGFILFKKRSGARKALKQPQKKIGNRMTACQLASIGPVPAPASVAAAAPTQSAVSEYTQRKIYVSNVGAELDPQRLITFFSKFGEIEEGPLGLDKMTGRPKGFCLFVYKSMDSAKKALEEPHKNFEGHILHCQKAIDGPKPGKSQQHHTHFPRNNDTNAYAAGTAAVPAHLMAPAAGFNQGAAPALAPTPTPTPALNPALGQALTALLASQGAGLGLTNLLGALGSAAAATQGVAAPGMQGAYGNQANISPGVIGAYGNQGAMQGGYLNQQMAQGGSGRGQHGVGQYGGADPYRGH